MITKEIVEGEEVFAIDGPVGDRCNECMFELLRCENIPCVPSQRVDQRNVYFRSTADLRNLAAYHAQEHRDVQ